MTSEVAIINRHGIALAADSAVTIGQNRVWKTTNKIFSLGPYNDIAVMIYGGAEYSGIPWETLVKTFKRERARSGFGSVAECCSEFVAFLNDPRWFDPIQNRLCPLSVIVKEIKPSFFIKDINIYNCIIVNSQSPRWCQIIAIIKKQ